MIIIDSNEASKNPDIHKLLDSKMEVKVQSLPSADYALTKGIGIERKEMSDLYNSVRYDNRLFDQLGRLTEDYERPILLVEGYLTTPYAKNGYRSYNNVMGTLISVLYAWKDVKLWFAPTRSDTVAFLRRSAVWAPSGRVPIPKGVRKDQDPKIVYRNMLMCIRGIGPKTVKNIIKSAPSMGKLIDMLNSSTLEDLVKNIKGLNSKTASILKKALR